MNIAMLTTWASSCGIAEYSRNLLAEFELQKHNILLLNNKLNVHTPKDCTIPKQIFSEDMQKKIEEFKLGDFVAAKVFGVHWWGEDPSFSSEKTELSWHLFEKENGPIDVLHVQYQGSLYEPEGFNALEKGVKCKKVITFHDSSRNPKHNFDSFTSISHNPDIEADNYISFPTIERLPVVFSFGMGRNDYEFIGQACKEIGVDFNWRDSRLDGWLSEEDLFKCMNDADAIVLWYNDVPIKGQSAALRTAISSMRPVIVNKVGWFQDAPAFVHAAKDKEQLQIILKDILHLDYIRKNSFKNCAKRHMEIYNGR
jgi:hypothetical protein